MILDGNSHFEKSYKPTDPEVWAGRVDDENDYEAFRWHQVVQRIDLLNPATFPADVLPGKSFCFLGFRCDKGVMRNKGRVGTSQGPLFIRKEMANMPCTFSPEVRLYDAGNIFPTEDDTLENAQQNLAIAAKMIVELGMFPIVLGGGHEIAFGHYMGLIHANKFENNETRLGIINFDAHFDLRPYHENGASSGTMFRQIADVCSANQRSFTYCCLGVQQTGNTVSLFKKAEELGVTYLMARDISDFRLIEIFDTIDRFIKKQEHVYVTICSDVFSSAFAPGVSASQPFGLHPEMVLKLLKHILKSGKVVSFDIAEVSPRFDHDNQTARLAAIVIFAVINQLLRE